MGTGPRPSQRRNELQPFVTVKITEELSNGYYKANEVRLEENASVVTWETFTGGRVFEDDNAILERNFVEGVEIGKIVTVYQSATHNPGSTSYLRPVTWMFDLGGGGSDVFPAQIQSKVSNNQYLCDVWEDGVYTDAGAGKPVTAEDQDLFIWQVSNAKEIPAGSWLMVTKVDEHYEGQIPVWL